MLVSGLAPGVLYGFISGYLGDIADRSGGGAYLLDGNGIVVAGPAVARAAM